MNSSEYRIRLDHYAESIYGTRPGEARRIRRLLRSTPMLPQWRRLPSGGYEEIRLPHPEIVEPPYDYPVIPWFKMLRWKDAGKGKVTIDE